MNDRSYRRYMLGLLTLILAFSCVDRSVLSIALQDLKQDLMLTDSQLGLLTGFSFALFYSVMGIPIARWADVGNRKTIIALTTTAWSIMLVLCGMITSFGQLLIARIGVAVGEAGCIPPANSLIPDYFTREERPRAMSVYLLGNPLSVIFGFLVGGWLVELAGWRMTFILFGIPGFVLGLVTWLTLREPRVLRHYPGSMRARGERAPISLLHRISHFWKSPTFRNLAFGFSLAGFFGSGIGVWLPVFLIRSHGMQTAEIGAWMALAWGIAGAIGAWTGGLVASRFAAGREERQLQAISIAFSLFSLVSATTYITQSRFIALLLMAFSAFLIASTLPSTFAAIQGITEERSRAQAIAVILFCNQLIGVGLGPLMAGVLSDSLSTAFEKESLRYALMFLSPGWLWAALHFWRASRTVEHDILLTKAADNGREASRAGQGRHRSSQCVLGENRR